MHSAWLRSIFLRALKFLHIKEGGPNFWWEPILQKVSIISSSLLYFNFKIFLDSNSSWFIIFQCILHDWGVLFSESWNFYKLKRGGPNLSGEPILQKVSIIWSPLLWLNFKSFVEPNSCTFIRYQSILHDWGVLFSESWNFYKLKTWGPNFWGELILQEVWTISSPFCISILKVFQTQIHRHSLDFNAFCTIEEYFSQSLEISKNKRKGT